MSAIELLTALARNVGGGRVRPYAVEVADLAIDFDAPRPIVATRVIAKCLHADEDSVWSLAVQDRIVLLLAISELSLADPVEAHLPCACGATAIVELSAEELSRFAAERRRSELVARAGETSATLRLPTGRDQLRWAQLDPNVDVAREIISALVVEGDLPLTDDLVAAADAVLTVADPLVELEVETSCTACGQALARTVDLERIALTRLRRARQILLEQVHVLATAYHWTEATIAELPAWRRAEYAALAATRLR